MFIGSRKITKEEAIENDLVRVTFKDGAIINFQKDLLEMIKTETEQKGDIMDMVKYELSKKFMAQLAYYRLSVFTGEHVANGLINLIKNSSNIAIAKKFGVDSPEDILISDLLLVNA